MEEPTTAESSGNSDQPAIPEEPNPALPLKVETDNNDGGSNNAPMETTSPKKSIEKPLGSPTETVHSALKAIESHSSKVPMPQSFPLNRLILIVSKAICWCQCIVICP